MKRGVALGSAVAAVAVAAILVFPGLGKAMCSLGVDPVTDPKVLKECGSCHMAFQPGWLPARSWEKMMSNLKDHFGDNATLNEADVKGITKYLTDNALDDSEWCEVSPEECSSAPTLRITEMTWFEALHDGTGPTSPKAMAKRGIKSKADCKACHESADEGDFSGN